MKKCRRCNETKEYSAYSAKKSNNDGYNHRCRSCLSEVKLIVRYGISIEHYEEMYEQQQGRCKICNIEEKHASRGKFHVDHCHKTEEVRGLLCGKCNRGLGMFRDNSEFLREAANYLEDA